MIKNQSQLVSRFKEEIEKEKDIDMQLQARLDVFLEKEKQFNGIIIESNQKYSDYKLTFDTLSDKQKKLDTSINEIKRKCEKTDTAMIDIVEKVY